MGELGGKRSERTQVYRIAYGLLATIGVAAVLVGGIYRSSVAIVLGFWGFALYACVDYKKKVALGAVSGELWRKYVVGALLLLLLVGPPIILWVPEMTRAIESHPGVGRALIAVVNGIVLVAALIQLRKYFKGQVIYSRAYVISLYVAVIALTLAVMFALAMFALAR